MAAVGLLLLAERQQIESLRVSQNQAACSSCNSQATWQVCEQLWFLLLPNVTVLEQLSSAPPTTYPMEGCAQHWSQRHHCSAHLGGHLGC